MGRAVLGGIGSLIGKGAEGIAWGVSEALDKAVGNEGVVGEGSSKGSSSVEEDRVVGLDGDVVDWQGGLRMSFSGEGGWKLSRRVMKKKRRARERD